MIDELLSGGFFFRRAGREYQPVWLCIVCRKKIVKSGTRVSQCASCNFKSVSMFCTESMILNRRHATGRKVERWGSGTARIFLDGLLVTRGNFTEKLGL